MLFYLIEVLKWFSFMSSSEIQTYVSLRGAFSNPAYANIFLHILSANEIIYVQA